MSIRPRYESEEEPESESASTSEQSDSDNEVLTQDSGSDTASNNGNNDEAADEGENLKDISFGALAEAQARLHPNPRKRKRLEEQEKPGQTRDGRDDKTNEHRSSYRDKPEHISRSSKHAPMIISSRAQVSRKRDIFSPPPAAKFRDPRFDAAVGADARRGDTASVQHASKNYAFLTDYQATEVLDLKAQLKKIKDPDQQAELRRQIMSTEAKIRNAQTQKREAEILQEHKRQERDAIREGRKAKPYYLKPSEVKNRIDQERQDAMGKRAKDKSEKRKKKREKTKEARDMPRFRRVV